MSESAPLSHDQTLELIAMAQTGDDAAQEALIINNAALVKSIVKKFTNRGTEYDDLYQIGCLGLVKAIRNFDSAYNVRFSTYAVPMIAGEIKRFLRDDGMIKVSRSLKEVAARAAAAQERLGRELGRDAGIAEIAKCIEEEVETVVMAMEAVRPHASIYEPAFGDDSDALLIDRVSGEGSEANDAINRVLLKELLHSLDPRERQIIMLRYFSDKTQGEIAKTLGVSLVQVSRLENRILSNLRERAT